MTAPLSSEERHRRRIALLRGTREQFDTLVMRGHAVPHRELFGKSPRKIVAGPAGSLLFALARVPVDGSRESHRRRANRALAQAVDVQAAIRERFLQPSQILEIVPARNPRIIDRATGSLIERLEWHHSPNHIMSMALLPQSLHRRPELHAAGRGAYAMFLVPPYK